MLKNPFCYIDDDKDDLIHVEDYIKHHIHKTPICPSTDQILTLRNGEIMTPHFALPHGFVSNGETQLHNYSKRLFQELIGETIIIKPPKIKVLKK
jgi:competence CoiA-like predicted nuclease